LKFVRLTLTLALIISIHGVSQASVILKLSTKDLAAQADEIVMGKITNQWTSADTQNKIIYTYLTVALDEAPIKSFNKHVNLRKTMTFRQVGGHYQDPNTGKHFRQKAFGLPNYTEGERGIFFVKHAKDGAPYIMAQGKFSIVEGSNKKATLVRELDTQVQYVDQNLKPMYISHMAYRPQEIYNVEAFLAEIRSSLGIAQ